MSAASGEPVVIVYDVRGEGPNPEGSYVTEAAYLTLAQQRDATERLCAQHEGKIHELRDQLAFAESALSGGLAENESLRARLAACEQKNERVMSIARRLALRSGFAAQALSELEAEGIDRAATLTTPPLDDDDGPNDGHARTVNRTPPQDAATTRGEG
jgi:hypothetical protein